MKNALKAFGKAILYFIVSPVAQIVAAILGLIVAGVSVASSMDMPVPKEQMEELQTKMMAEYEGSMLVWLLISNLLSLLVIWLFFKLRKKKLFVEIGLAKCAFMPSVVYVIFGIGFALAVNLLIAVIPFPASMVNTFVEGNAALTQGSSVLGFFSVAILAPIVEEVFIRGLVYTRLKRGIPMIAAAVISSVLFGILHSGGVWAIFAALIGLMLVFVLEKTGSLLPCIIIHVVNNAVSDLTPGLTGTAAEYVIMGIGAVMMTGAGVYLYIYEKRRKAA